MPRTDPHHPVRLTGPNRWISGAENLNNNPVGSLNGNADWLESVPLCGYDRNQPLRRILSALGNRASPSHQDPGIIYHFDGRTIPRRSSVEMWIETCRELFPEKDLRDFWEVIWNMAVKAWDYIDLMGRFPTQAPYVGFPLFTPALWKGSRRSRFLFQPFPRFLESMDLHQAGSFRNWLETLLGFQYGLAPERMTLGMTALALNAPSETYLPGETLPILQALSDRIQVDHSPSRSPGWRIEVSAPIGEWYRCGPVHQFFWGEPVNDLAVQTMLLTIHSAHKGWLYVRGEFADMEKQNRVEAQVLQRIYAGTPVECPPSGEILRWERVGEGSWPWLGMVTCLVGMRQTGGVL